MNEWFSRNRTEKPKRNGIETERSETTVMHPNILDVLLDRDNTDPVVLTNQSGKAIAFEQVAVVPYNKKVYAVLKPVGPMEGVGRDEAIVFYVDVFEDTPMLVAERDEQTMLAVFKKYYDMLEKKLKKG